jgi:hypothetical protein
MLCVCWQYGWFYYLWSFVGLLPAARLGGHAIWQPKMLKKYYLAVSVASFSETLFPGGPILIVMYDNPTSWYLMSSAVIICVGCMTILQPQMLPKYFARLILVSVFSPF